jgi:hypothetical protein
MELPSGLMHDTVPSFPHEQLLPSAYVHCVTPWEFGPHVPLVAEGHSGLATGSSGLQAFVGGGGGDMGAKVSGAGVQG